MGKGWGAVFTVSLIAIAPCLILGTSRSDPAPAPWMLGLLVVPGFGIIASGVGYWTTKHLKRHGGAMVCLGLAVLAGGLDHLFDGGRFLLLVLPLGVANLLFAGFYLFTPAGRAANGRWVGIAGGLLFAVGAFLVGFEVGRT